MLGARVSLAVRVSDPKAFAARLRTVAADVDPMIRLTDIQPPSQVGGSEAAINWALTSVAWLISFMVLLLSASGIHALMSFTVARRTREIAIRAALGAPPGRIVAGIFSHALLQINAGMRRDVRVVEGARLEIALAVCDGVLQISITVAKPTT